MCSLQSKHEGTRAVDKNRSHGEPTKPAIDCKERLTESETGMGDRDRVRKYYVDTGLHVELERQSRLCLSGAVILTDAALAWGLLQTFFLVEQQPNHIPSDLAVVDHRVQYLRQFRHLLAFTLALSLAGRGQHDRTACG
jgi:hypothetical protein